LASDDLGFDRLWFAAVVGDEFQGLPRVRSGVGLGQFDGVYGLQEMVYRRFEQRGDFDAAASPGVAEHDLTA
jgi:hypothetical protein